MSVDQSAERTAGSSVSRWPTLDPTEIAPWDDYARRDTRSVSDYLFDAGDDGGDVEAVRRVPTSDYLSADQARLERERLWSTVWQMACRANDIPEPGDYLEYDIAGTALLIVRTSAGDVVAMHAACRHRGRLVATGSGNSSCFTCPFHGWRYDLDGDLDLVTAGWEFPDLDRSTMGLRRCQAEVFDGWVFINLDLEAPPLASFLGDTIRRHFDVTPSAELWKLWHVGKVVRCNWKVMTEAFFETYHVSRTHPTLIISTSDIQSRYDAYGLHSRLITPFLVSSALPGDSYTEADVLAASFELSRARGISGDGDAEDPSSEAPAIPDGATARVVVAEGLRQMLGAQGIDLSAISDSELLDGILYQVFPNFMPFRGPAGHVAYRFRPIGDDPDTCIFEAMMLVPLPPGVPRPKDTPLRMLGPDETFEHHATEMAGLGYFLDQDVDNCDKIQVGLRSLDEIVLADRQERNIARFHHHLASWLASHG